MTKKNAMKAGRDFQRSENFGAPRKKRLLNFDHKKHKKTGALLAIVNL